MTLETTPPTNQPTQTQWAPSRLSDGHLLTDALIWSILSLQKPFKGEWALKIIETSHTLSLNLSFDYLESCRKDWV